MRKSISFAVVTAVQHLMGLAVGVMVYALLRRYGLPGWGATLAALPVLLDAYQIELEHEILPSATFGFLIMVAITLTLWWRRDRPLWATVAAGFVLAAAATLWPVGLPVLILFLPGRSAGVIASVIYAVPPCVRLTALGLTEVPSTPREAAISFGATPRQELFKVQLPLAFRSVMLGINQTVLMVLATVIIAALIGAGALGLLSLGGFQKQQSQIGQGLAAGLSIVLLAIVLDRITQAWGRPRPDRR